MKFLSNHKKDITDLIAKRGLDQLAFSYVKKKGRINIIHDNSKSHFAYLRRKEVALNESNHQWDDKTYYKVQQNDQKEIVMATWDLVLVGFEKWLELLVSKRVER